MSFDSLLRNRCTIRRATRANVDGVIQLTWSDLATQVPCLVQEGAGRVMPGKSGQALEYEAIGFFRFSQDIRPKGGDDTQDQIVMTTPATSVKYLVLKVGDEAGIGHHLEAYLKRLPSET